MNLIQNLHHSDETSGTTVVEHNGKELRVHWTEGHSDAIICEGGIRGAIIGVIRADGETSHDDWEALKPILEEPGAKARPMTEEEEQDHDGAIAASV